MREWKNKLFHGLLDGSVDAGKVVEQIETLPSIGDAFSNLEGLQIEASILAGAGELGFYSERLKAYEKKVRENEMGAENKRAKSVVRIANAISQRDFSAGHGFRITKKRIALTENLVAVESDEANQAMERA